MLLFIHSCIRKSLHICLRSVLFLILSSGGQAAVKKIAVIVPLEHEAMTRIVAGIQEALSTENVEIILKNAQGDNNILLSLINQLKDQEINIIMPIGTMTSQMTLSHIENIPIICVAARLDPKNHSFVTGINDEIPVSEVLRKLPFLKKIAVFYSASEKIAPEIEALKIYARQADISLHLGMVQTLLDLPSAVLNVPENTQAFLILKDHLLVSGISILRRAALKKSIPIIACDEGSVLKGATLGIGVTEKEIGLKAGLMAKNILQGAKPSSIPYQTLDSLSLFINKENFLKQSVLREEDLKKIDLPLIISGKK